MAYTAPRTWVAGEIVTATLMNTHLRDNLIALKDPPSAASSLNVSDLSTTSTSFTNIDGTNLSLSVTTTGGDLMVGFSGSFVMTNTDLSSRCRGALDFTVDGTRQGNTDGILSLGEGGFADHADDEGGTPVSFVRLVTGLAAGAHTINMQWKAASDGTGTTTIKLFGGAGSTYNLSEPQFWAREVS